VSGLQAGSELEPLVIEEVRPGPMKVMALLLRDPNPIHWDPGVVAELGLGEKPINQGPINVGYLMELAARSCGGPQNVRRFSVRFTGNVFAGDRVVCEGTVAAVDPAAGTAELRLRAVVGERSVLEGSAVVALPSGA